MFDATRRCYGPAKDWRTRRANMEAVLADMPETSGPRRVCYPSSLDPHNLEGFFLHFGDALSKSGRLEDARQAWHLAFAAPAYATWPYRDFLEARIANPEARSRIASSGQRREGMMITSPLACSGCHQR